MATILEQSAETYSNHLPIILLFSISFVIALLIPVFASFPTYGDLGGIFLRTASLFLNLSYISGAVIIFSALFSLLFLSFAIVAICVIVKHSRTYTKIAREVMQGLERYTGKVFLILLVYGIIILLLQLLTYVYNVSAAVASVVGLLITPIFFYAPVSLVIDDNRIVRAMQASWKFFTKRADYFVLWIVLAIILLTVFDFIFVSIAGASLSSYVMLIFNALFIMPFLVVLQAEMYMRRFKLVRG